jgi:O-antigen/teichoic acid export membrane protein
VPGLTSVTAALIRNTAWHGFVTLVGLGSGLVMSVLLARSLGPERMGDYSYITWAWTTLDALATLGFAVATARFTAERLARGDGAGASGFVRYLLRRQTVSTLIVVAAVLPLVLTLAPPPLRWALVIVTLALVPMTIESVYTHALFGAQRYDVTARLSTLKMALQLAVTVVALALGAGIVGLFGGLSITLVVSSLVLRYAVARVYPQTPAVVPTATRRDIRGYLISLSIVTALDAVVWNRSEVFFLGVWGDARDIAYYSLAFGLATRAMIVPEIAVGALLPTFSALYGAGDREGFVALYRSALRYVALAGALVAALVAALAPGIIDLLYGGAYAPAAGLLAALAAIALVSALRQVAWAALPALGDRRAALMATGVAALVNLAVAAWLIPEHGTMGAVVANGAGQVIATAWVFVALGRRHRCPFPVDDLLRIVAAAVLAFLSTRLVGVALAADAAEPISVLLAALAGAAVFVAACLLGGVLRLREWTVLIAAARRRPA